MNQDGEKILHVFLGEHLLINLVEEQSQIPFVNVKKPSSLPSNVHNAYDKDSGKTSSGDFDLDDVSKDMIEGDELVSGRDDRICMAESGSGKHLHVCYRRPM